MFWLSALFSFLTLDLDLRGMCLLPKNVSQQALACYQWQYNCYTVTGESQRQCCFPCDLFLSLSLAKDQIQPETKAKKNRMIITVPAHVSTLILVSSGMTRSQSSIAFFEKNERISKVLAQLDTRRYGSPSHTSLSDHQHTRPSYPSSRPASTAQICCAP
jgi:hypothetical protein